MVLRTNTAIKRRCWRHWSGEGLDQAWRLLDRRDTSTAASHAEPIYLDEVSAALLESLAGIVQRSAGNPLYMEERTYDRRVALDAAGNNGPCPSSDTAPTNRELAEHWGHHLGR